MVASHFITGALAFGYFTLGVFFLKFWRRRRTTLFGYFAIAFFVLGTSRVMQAFLAGDEFRAESYVVRLVAFVLMIVGIAVHNRRQSAGRDAAAQSLARTPRLGS